jgi:hypothetical protein
LSLIVGVWLLSIKSLKEYPVPAFRQNLQNLSYHRINLYSFILLDLFWVKFSLISTPKGFSGGYIIWWVPCLILVFLILILVFIKPKKILKINTQEYLRIPGIIGFYGLLTAKNINWLYEGPAIDGYELYEFCLKSGEFKYIPAIYLNINPTIECMVEIIISLSFVVYYLYRGFVLRKELKNVDWNNLII